MTTTPEVADALLGVVSGLEIAGLTSIKRTWIPWAQLSAANWGDIDLYVVPKNMAPTPISRIHVQKEFAIEVGIVAKVKDIDTGPDEPNSVIEKIATELTTVLANRKPLPEIAFSRAAEIIVDTDRLKENNLYVAVLPLIYTGTEKSDGE